MSQEAKGIKKGDYYAKCDLCGGKFFGNTMKLRWDGLFVCDNDYDERPEVYDLHSVSEDNRRVAIARPMMYKSNTEESSPITDMENWYGN